MKEVFGSPGKVSGLLLRLGQCSFAAASIWVMTSASGFSISTAFCYLIASMALQALWSFGLVCLDITALRLKKDLRDYMYLWLFAVGDWVISTLSLAAASSSAGVAVMFIRDTNLCKIGAKLSCTMFQISVAWAFAAWFLLAVSAYVMLWLVSSAE